MSAVLDIPGIPAVLPPLLLALAREQRAALVGGAVRDLLLHRVHNDPWRGLPDLDLVVEGRAADFVRRLAGLLPPAALRAEREHGAYGTVELELVLDGRPLLVDVASARRESYPVPGENPRVSPGALADDLARRDFSINAMALDLASGQLLDPHGGQADLRRRRLRWLHGASVRDDPTRLVRGARYAARLGLELDPASLEQVHTTLAAWPWAWHPGDPPGLAPAALATRLRRELELLLRGEPWRAALDALQRWGALVLLDPSLQAERRWPQRLWWAERFGVPPLTALVAGAGDPLALAERLQLPRREHLRLAQALMLRRRLASAAPAPADAAGWSELLEQPGHSRGAVALALVSGAVPRRPLLRWLLRWRRLGAPRTAAELIAAGWRPGPELGAELRRLRAWRLAEERC